MRTAIVVDEFPRGTETFIVRHVRGLRADVVARTAAADALADWTWKPHLHRLREGTRQRPAWPRRIGRGLAVRGWGARGLRWPAAMERLFDEYVEARRPDVVLAEFGPNGVRASGACARHGIPLVVHFHGDDLEDALFPFLQESAQGREAPPIKEHHQAQNHSRGREIDRRSRQPANLGHDQTQQGGQEDGGHDQRKTEMRQDL